MAGWEQLTPNEIMTIAWIGLSCVSIFTFGTLFKSIINWRISKRIQVKIEESVDKSVAQVNIWKLIKDARIKHKLKKQKEIDMVLSGYDPGLEKYSRS